METVIRFKCSACGADLKADSRKAGRFTDCPMCKTPLRVPDEDELKEAKKTPVVIEGELSKPNFPFRPVRLVRTSWLSVAAWPAGLVVGCIIGLVLQARLLELQTRMKDIVAFQILFWPPFLGYLFFRVCFLREMHKVWKHIIYWSKRDHIKIPVNTADAAIALLFVPFYNFWWAIQFYGVGAYLNAVAEPRGIHVSPAAEDLGGVICFFGVVGLVFLNVGFCYPPALFGLLLSGLAFEATLVVLAHNLQTRFNEVGKIVGGVPR